MPKGCIRLYRDSLSPILEIIFLKNIQGRIDYFIAESSYNRLLASLGKEPLDLGENRAALYTSMSGSDFQSILAGALKRRGQY